MPTAFTVSMLAWGALAFPTGYQKAHQMPQLLNTVRWGSDYLMKAWKPDTMSDRSVGYLIVYQVRLLHSSAQHPLLLSASGEGTLGSASMGCSLRPLPLEVHADQFRATSVSKRGNTVMSAVKALCAQYAVCVAVQVGNLTTDVNWWNRPEAMTEENMKRPAYAINTRMGASDIAGRPPKQAQL